MERELQDDTSPGGRGTGKTTYSRKGKASTGSPQKVDAPKRGRVNKDSRGTAEGKVAKDLKRKTTPDKGTNLGGLREDQPGRDPRGDRNSL